MYGRGNSTPPLKGGMGLITFSVENYRAFARPAEIRLRPLTLLFGYNSAGKSALLRWLPFLRDSLQPGAQPLNLSAASMRGAGFDKVLSKFTSSNALTFELKGSSDSIKYIIRYLTDKRTQIVDRFEVNLKDISASIEWLADGERPNLYKLTTSDGVRPVDVVFSGLLPVITSELDLTVSGMASVAERFLHRHLAETYWLQANRCSPARKEVYTGTPSTILPDGSGITARLFEQHASGSDIIEALSSWYERATGFRLSLQRGAFLSSELFSYCLETAGESIELADTGEGMGQVLPVVGLLLLAQRGLLGSHPTLLLEHPELHLHSAAEPALANLLCDVAAKGSVNIVAETHSETFLLALQLAVIEGRLKPKDVAVYWVRQPQGEPATLNEILFDEGGRPQGGAWPTGVFDDKTEQARKVVLARKDKTRKNAS